MWQNQNKLEDNGIPREWIKVKIGEIFFTTSGGTPSRKNESFYNGNIPWVKSGELKEKYIYKTEENITEEAIKQSNTKIFPKGTLLIALYGATIGKLSIIDINAATNQAICGIFENGTEINFLYYYLLHKREKLIQSAIGGAQPNISQSTIRNLNFPLPPLPEQRAIVVRIEELFSRLDKGIETLQKVKEQLSVYRQAVLKWAFEGKLTRSWNSPSNISWQKVTLKNVCLKIQDGTHYSPKIQYSEPGPNRYMYITAKNIKNNYIDLKNVTWIDKNFHDKIYSRCNPEYGDILLTKDGVNTGNVTINTIKEPFSMLSSLCLLKIDKKKLLPEYLKYYIQSPIGSKNLLGKMTGTAIRRIVLRKIKEFSIKLPPLSLQQAIVQEIETRLSVADKLEQIIDESLQKAEALRQSILKKAFEGKLLSEAEREALKKDPEWELAEKLLERIKAEKEKLEANNNRKKRNRKN